MPFKLDPEVAAGMAVLAPPPGTAPPPPPGVGDIATRRANVDLVFGMIFPPPAKDVSMKDFYATAPDGHQILLRYYTKIGPGSSGKSPAVVYYHGGGYIAGSVPLYDPVCANYVSKTGVPFLSVEYRLAPEFTYPVPVSDAYVGLVWMHKHASELRIDPARIAIMGDSGGGGIAAAVTHYAKKMGGPIIPKQILVYPMLDDRNTQHDAHIGAFAMWSAIDNETGWGAMLGSRRGTSGVPADAAPARMTDATGLPPLYIETGELDIFRAEDLEYAAKFGRAGVSVEMHVHAGCPHGFEVFAPNSKVALRAMADRYRAIQSIEPLEGVSSRPKL